MEWLSAPTLERDSKEGFEGARAVLTDQGGRAAEKDRDRQGLPRQGAERFVDYSGNTSIREKKAPILIGTASVESSEEVSDLLRKNNVPHQVLNAKNHAKEAEIIANAGKPSSVTIATNMAGRGTDIVLGGKSQDKDLNSWKLQNNQVLDSGGLHILGTERHESRRIDNQLRVMMSQMIKGKLFIP